jgi:CheY-like chemotaxis protein
MVGDRELSTLKCFILRIMNEHDLSKLHILVIDDNHHMTIIIKTLLRGLGVVNITEARGGIGGYEKFKTRPIDLIITDYLMSPVDGITFTKRIRTGNDNPNPQVPIIMLSAYSEPQRVKQARDAGVTEFLCKPVTALALYSRLQSVINRPRDFVESVQFLGPDRRRRRASGYEGAEKRKPENAEQIK